MLTPEIQDDIIQIGIMMFLVYFKFYQG